MENILRRNILCFVMFTMCIVTSAHDFKVDGIYYKITSSSKCAVTYKGDTYSSYSKEYNGNITIPASVTYYGNTYEVTSIESCAFSSCSGLTSVTIPNSVTSIGSSAFSSCSGLTSVIIPNSVTSIGSYAFSVCSGLTSVTIPNSVTSIGAEAFYGCSSLTSVTIPNSVTSIGKNAFYGTAWYNNQPDGLVYAGNVAYRYKGTMPNNTSVVLKEGTTVIGSSAFSGRSGLTSITIPNSVTSIGGSAFYGCSSLTSVTIPNSVTSIGSYAFNGCSGLQKVIVPNFNIKNWCSIKFDDSSANPLYYAHHLYSDENTEITELVIPDDVTSIGALAFYRCSGLTSVTIGNSVTSIGDYAFSGCSGLTSVTIGNSVTSIGSYAFNGCSGLQKVIVPNFNIKNWCSIKFDDSSANPLYYAHHLYSDENTEITELVIPDDVTSIGALAFYRCSGLTSVTIPNSVTTISSSAFSGCSGLTSMTIPKGVTSIGSSAFSGCNGLTSITWNAKNYPAFSSYSDNPFYYIRTKITEFIIGDDMKSIPKYMCYGMSNLKSVTIPNNVTSIGSEAFKYCSGLTSVTIPNSVITISSSAFENCSGLTSVTIPNSVTTISSSAFSGCSGLTSVTIGNSVTSIGSTIFSGCSSLTFVRFENSKDNTPVVLENNKVFSDCPLDEVYIGRKLSYTKTSSAGYSPFHRNTTLRSVKFTDKETEISDYEFYGCTNLTDVSMGDGVNSIGAYAFSGCSSLEHFTCGRQLKSIGKEAFSACTSMTKFRTRAAVPPTCGAQALDDINKWECTLYVPTESIDDYQAADQWKNFFFIEKFNLQGDANGDSQIDVADFTAIANFILGSIPENFEEDAADVNKDEIVNVADITGVANIILYGSLNSSAAAKGIGGMEYRIPVMQAKDFAISAGGEYVMDIDIENPDMQFSACQFDVHLPKGISIKSVTLGNDRTTSKKTNYLDFATLADGTTRVICASTKDVAFAGTEGTVARLTVVADNNVEAGSYDVTIDNIVLSKAGDMAKPESVTINADISSATGISEIKTAEPNSADGMYDILGRRISNSEKLRDGIYIIRGKKVIK